jgi:hypothetical protein
MDMSPGGQGRMTISLIVIALVAVSVPYTIDDDKFRKLTYVVLGFFAVRILLGRFRSR